MARNYKANGFFVVNAVGYKLTHLVAAKSGVYGVYAFNSKGGEMSHSESYYHSDAGFYIGQTPQQTKPIRSVVRDVTSWGNPIGFSATNMRYVTISGSRFYNNAIGIVPNALESEKFPPAEANVITDNDIFWNNFNVHAGAPFKPKKTGVVPLVPVGTGVLLLGGRTQPRRGQPRLRQLPRRRRGRRGHPARQDHRGARPDRQPDLRQRVRRGRHGPQRPRPRLPTATAPATAGGRTPASRRRCRPTRAMFPACPFSGANAFSQDAQNQLLGFAGANALNGWIKHPHKAKPGYTPLEVYKK